jgi:isopentenyl-diphosphate delta-isomerase
MAEEVILVDAHDQALGLMEKMEAHRQGLLHRAFSVFVLNTKGELLLQQRAAHKYHSGGLWTNTVCSHPREKESVESAAHRRLEEEMGFDCPIEKAFEFTYRAELDKGMIEHEYDHLFTGWEVMDFRWQLPSAVEQDLQHHPEHYTAWFKIIFQRFTTTLKQTQ